MARRLALLLLVLLPACAAPVDQHPSDGEIHLVEELIRP